MFFMPDFDETNGYYEAADAWWDYWGDVVDGIFSWETSWPERKGFGGLTAGDVSVDVLPMAGAHNRSKPYMMGLSPLHTVQMSTGKPDYVQFITWNYGPESHYIGNLWTEQNNDTQPWFYENQLAASCGIFYRSIQKWKEVYGDGTTDWTLDCGYGSAGQYYEKPDGFTAGVDDVWWSVILSPDAAPPSHQPLGGGGHVRHRRTCVDTGCPNLIYNSNYQVIPLEGSKSKQCTAISKAEDTTCSGSSCKSTVFDGNGPSAWRNVDCTWYTVENASYNAATRWNTIFTESAWADLNQYWLSHPHEGELNYTNEISNLVHSPEHMDCSKMADSVGCDSFVSIAVNTWTQMGNTSSFLNPSAIGALDDIFDQGIRSAGVVHIPVGTISELKKTID
ncbi:hypothetical protein BP00DRAFT_446129 [Aspergillus indologenus CBS 114.80]|uniref:Uncharacterized protein n=1 Tax=Aspergillus indologenus CBS 114.80 TaxID=1450541 RepID=A0A2V5I584_9EURO|nr:hypothetical protein BP00DRAFT_446129 [Aspergillus indologenus CBS 114.80]